MKKYVYIKIISDKNTFFYLDFGKKYQKTILCLHGYADTAEIFAKLGYLLSNNYRIIALDFPMSHNNNSVYSLDSLTEYVLDFVKRVNIEGFDLFGFSLGGLVAINVAYKSNKVEKLFIANIVPAILNNFFERAIYKTVCPLLTTRLFCNLFSKLKSNSLWANKIGTKKDSTTLLRMKQNYYSIFATMFSFGRVDLTKIFNNLSNNKYLFIFKDDGVISYVRYKKQIERLKCNYYFLEDGGHLSKTDYWNNVVPIIRQII